jgi:glutathione S-transferase
MKLYGSLTSPYVRKVRILLKEKTIPCDFIQVDAWAADSPVVSLNPLGKVPVLELDNGRTYFESSFIIDYLDSMAGEPLIPREGASRWAVLFWHALSQGMVDAVVTRLLETRRPREKQMPEVITRQQDKIQRSLSHAATADKGFPYLIDDRFTLADLSLAVALEYIDFRYPHEWRDTHPRLAYWLAGIMTRPSFAETEPPEVERTVGAPH